MIALLQRVTHAEARVAGESVGAVGRGLLVLAAVERGDDEARVERIAERILGYRVFPDEAGKMNRNVTEIDGELLLVSQFTLAADTRKGARPSFTPAAAPEEGLRLFEHFVETVRARYPRIATGRFGADMQVSLVNDGPVTFILQSPPLS